MRYAYADQNFLSNCTLNDDWRATVIHVRQAGIVALVLSPIHFLEIGRNRDVQRERLVEFVEQAQTYWAFSQADMQKRELAYVWDSFYSGRNDAFKPFGTLHEIAGAMHRVPAAVLARYTLRDWVKVFAAKPDIPDHLREIWSVLNQQNIANVTNRRSFRQGNMTQQIFQEMERRHIAVQLESLRSQYDDANELYKHALTHLATQPGRVAKVPIAGIANLLP